MAKHFVELDEKAFGAALAGSPDADRLRAAANDALAALVARPTAFMTAIEYLERIKAAGGGMLDNHIGALIEHMWQAAPPGAYAIDSDSGWQFAPPVLPRGR